MKLCIHCKWAEEKKIINAVVNTGPIWVCNRASINPVDGEIMRVDWSVSCRDQRGGGACGYDGLYWEAKELYRPGEVVPQ